MARVAITHESFVMAPASAQRTSPTRLTVVLRIDVAAVQELTLLFTIETGRNMTQRVLIGIDEAMARRDIARRSHANQPEPRAAGVRFIHTLAQLGERVADVFPAGSRHPAFAGTA